ncbi:MAG: type I phosphomannose isomerase catalytic subunit [Planctomycetota bacterium]
MPDMPLYPLKLEPIYKAKVWGGRRFETLDRDLPDGDIGESWELADLSTTSASGGGGGAERSVVTNGHLAGQTVHDVMKAYGRDLLGDLPLTESGDFPLLVKFLDANENLSVQVHPSADYAATHDDAYLKSECWYVVAANVDAAIYKGVKAGTTPDRFRRAIADNTVEDLLIRIPVEAGDFHYLPSGTCHALGAGVMVAEVQTPSDTTFRVYDWGRTGRELHIDAAMQCIDFGPLDASAYEPLTRVEGDHAVRTFLCRNDYFHVHRVEVEANFLGDCAYGEPVVWTVLKGGGMIICGQGAPDVQFRAGQTILVPPDLARSRITVHGPTTWLETTFPQAKRTRLA